MLVNYLNTFKGLSCVHFICFLVHGFFVFFIVIFCYVAVSSTTILYKLALKLVMT